MLEWLAHRLPKQLLTEPERLMLGAAWVLIGIDATFLGAPTSGIAKAPMLLRIEDGVLFLVGGIAIVLGIWHCSDWAERLGHAFVTLGCVVYVWAVIHYVGKGGIPASILYICVAVTYGLRLVGCSVLRSRLRKEVKALNGANQHR